MASHQGWQRKRIDERIIQVDHNHQKNEAVAVSVPNAESQWSPRPSSEVSIPSTQVSRNGMDPWTVVTQVSPLNSPRQYPNPPSTNLSFPTPIVMPYDGTQNDDSSSTLLPEQVRCEAVGAGKKTERTCWRDIWDMEESWSLEIAALILSVASFSVVVSLLFRYDEKSLSSWKGSTISLNTVISILAGISKASLALVMSACLGQFKWNWIRQIESPLIDFDRLDGASRGPWGSCRLLATMARRPHWLAIGALTTIILIGFEPFLQGLITFEDRLAPISVDDTTKGVSQSRNEGNSSDEYSPTSALIGKCSRLKAGSYMESLTSSPNSIPFNNSKGEELKHFGIGGYDLRIDPGMTAAVWNGFSTVITDQNLWPSYLCSTGNCTWSSFSSLAVCSRCNDITKHLNRSKKAYRMPGISNFGWPDGVEAPPVSNQGTRANAARKYNSTGMITMYELAEVGLSLSNYDGPPDCSDFNSVCADTHMTVMVTTNPGLTLSFDSYRTLILAVQVIEADPSWKLNETLWEDTKVTATECSLSYCVNVYRPRVEKGILYEDVMETWMNKTPDSFWYGSSLPKEEEEWLMHRNYTLNNHPDHDHIRDDLQLFIPTTHNGNASEFAGETFNVTQGTVTTAIEIFGQGFGSLNETKSPPIRRNPMFIYPSEGIEQPGFIYSLGETGNITKSFETVALSLTKWMRDRVWKESHATGEMKQMVVVIRVQWKYLVWPSATLFGGIVFAVLSILETKRIRLPAWRNSSLAILANGPDPALGLKLENAVLTKDVFGVARKTKVFFEYRDGLGAIVPREKQ